MKILFLCVANSARSQIAHGLARAALPRSVVVESAGSNPAAVVHPAAVKALAEVGIDASKAKPRGLDSLSPGFLAEVDYVITLCAEEVCPTLPQANRAVKRLHWPIPDPAAAPEHEWTQAFRAARTSIQDQLNAFLEDAGLRDMTFA